MKFWKFWFLILAMYLFGFASVTSAGGWATIEATHMPSEIRAGEAAEVQFAVRQHGEHLRHEIDFGAEDPTPITPIVTLREVATGETLMFKTNKLEEVGYFSVMLEVPHEGEWAWEITPQPLAGDTSLPNLTVLPAAVGNESAESTSSTALSLSPGVSFSIVIAVLFVIAGGMLLVGRRQTSSPA